MLHLHHVRRLRAAADHYCLYRLIKSNLFIKLASLKTCQTIMKNVSPEPKVTSSDDPDDLRAATINHFV